MKYYKNIILNFVSGGLSRGVSALTPILLLPLMVKHWGLEIYAEYLTITALSTYFLICPDLGVTTALHNELAICGVRNEKERARRLYSSCFWAVTATGAALMLLIVLLVHCFDINALLNIKKLPLSETRLVFEMSCLQILFSIFSSMQAGRYRYCEKYARFSLITSMFQLLQVFGGLLLLLFGASCVSYAMFLVLCGVLRAIWLSLDSIRLLPWMRLMLRGNCYSELLQYVKPGIGFVALTLINALQNQGLILVLMWSLGGIAVAMFQICRTVTNALGMMISVAWMAFYPEVAAIRERGCDKELDLVFGRMIRLNIWGVVVAIGLIFGFRHWIFTIWMGPGFVYSGVLFGGLLLLSFPNMLYMAFSLTLAGLNQAHRIVGWTVFLRSVNLILVYYTALYCGVDWMWIPCVLSEFVVVYLQRMCFLRLGLLQHWRWREIWHIQSLPDDLNSFIVFKRSQHKAC